MTKLNVAICQAAPVPLAISDGIDKAVRLAREAIDGGAKVVAFGETFLGVYPELVARHMDRPWDAEQRKAQLAYRGLYAEFNLVYDRGTRFGLMTGGNPEAVLMSLPPVAEWP